MVVSQPRIFTLLGQKYLDCEIARSGEPVTRDEAFVLACETIGRLLAQADAQAMRLQLLDDLAMPGSGASPKEEPCESSS